MVIITTLGLLAFLSLVQHNSVCKLPRILGNRVWTPDFSTYCHCFGCSATQISHIYSYISKVYVKWLIHHVSHCQEEDFICNCEFFFSELSCFSFDTDTLFEKKMQWKWFSFCWFSHSQKPFQWLSWWQINVWGEVGLCLLEFSKNNQVPWLKDSFFREKSEKEQEGRDWKQNSSLQVFCMLRAFLSTLFWSLDPRASHFCHTAVFYMELIAKQIF